MDLLKFKWYYFLVATINGIFGMAMPLYYEGINFTPMQVSLLIAMPSIVMLLQPFWGMIVDKYENPREVAIFGMMGSSTIILSLLFIIDYKTVVLIIFLYCLLRAPVWSTVDNIIITYCMNRGINYGPLRVFASVAWGSSLLLVFPFVLFFGFKSYFILSFISGIILSIIIYSFPSTTKLTSKNNENVTFIEGLKILMTNKSFYFIIVFTFFFSSTFVTNLNYQSLYLREVGISGLGIALITFASIVPEFFILPQIEKYLKKFDSFTWLMLVCILYAIRYFVMGLTTSILIFIIFTSLHGVAMSFYIPVYIKHIKMTVPNVVSTTALTINSFMAATSGILMSFLAGMVRTVYGIHFVFYMNVVVMMFAFIVLVLYKRSVNKMFDKK